MLRFSGGSVANLDDTTRSPTRTSPSLGSTKPAISRNVVVLPQPEGPSRQTSLPCSMRSDTSSTTAVGPYRLVRFFSSTDATRPPCLETLPSFGARRRLEPGIQELHAGTLDSG